MPQPEEVPQVTNFGSSEALLAHIKSRADDLQRAVIPTAPVQLTYMGVPQAVLPVGMILFSLEDRREMITVPDAELLLNDGILNRMRVKIEIGLR